MLSLSNWQYCHHYCCSYYQSGWSHERHIRIHETKPTIGFWKKSTSWKTMRLQYYYDVVDCTRVWMDGTTMKLINLLPCRPASWNINQREIVINQPRVFPCRWFCVILFFVDSDGGWFCNKIIIIITIQWRDFQSCVLRHRKDSWIMSSSGIETKNISLEKRLFASSLSRKLGVTTRSVLR